MWIYWPEAFPCINIRRSNTLCSLSDLFLWAVLSSIINALREVLDQANALSNADLLLLCQLCGQTGLTRCGVVHGHVSLLLYEQKQRRRTPNQVMEIKEGIKCNAVNWIYLNGMLERLFAGASLKPFYLSFLILALSSCKLCQRWSNPLKEFLLNNYIEVV